MNCTNCNKEFEAKRADAKFCSDACRKKLSRTDVTDNKSDKIISDTKCQYCNYQITPEVYGDAWELVETCYDCVANINNMSRRNYPVHV